jgi:hypothetical protein
MTSKRRCAARTTAGDSCAAAPMRDSAYCFWHAPEHEADRVEAQRLGRGRRRREVALGGVYEFEGVAALDGVGRLLDVAAFDTLELPNSVQRNRTLVAVAMAGLKVKEVAELEKRIEDLEAAHRGPHPDHPSPFDQEPSVPFVGDEPEAGAR